MAVTFRGASEDARGNANPVVPTPPSGLQSGDLLLAVQVSDVNGSLSEMTAPSGWSQIASTSRSDVGFVKVWRKTATGSEPSTYEFPDSTSAHCDIVIVAVHGHDTSTPLAVTPTFSNGSSSSTHTAPSVTGVVDGLLVTAHIAGTNGTTRSYSTPSGMSLAQDSTLSSNGNILLGVYYDDLSSDGPTGAKIATCSASRPFITMTLVVRPPTPLTVSTFAINSAQAFGSPTLNVDTTPQTVTAVSIGSAQAMGVPTVDLEGIAPGPFPSSTLFPGTQIFPGEAPPADLDQTVAPATIPTAQAFGSPIVALADGPQTVIVTGIDTTETWAIPLVTVDLPAQQVEPDSIVSREVFGRPELVHGIPAPVVGGAWIDTYFVDGVNLTQHAWAIEVAEGLLTTPGVVGEDVDLPGRDGALQVLGGLGQQRRPDAIGRITFNLWLLGGDQDTGYVPQGSTTQAEWFQRWDELVRLFHRRRVILDHPRPDGTVRRAIAHLVPDESITPSRTPGSPWFGRFRAVFAIPDGHWSDLFPVTTGQVSLTTNGLLLLDSFALATAPCTELTVVFGSGNNPRLSTPYGHLGWNGVIAPGFQLGIDTGTGLTHQASGAAWTPGYDFLTYSPGPRLFEIDPSEPLQAILTHTGGGEATVEVRGKRRYRTS